MRKLEPGDMVKILSTGKVGVVMKKTYSSFEWQFDRFEVLLEGDVSEMTRQEIDVLQPTEKVVKSD